MLLNLTLRKLRRYVPRLELANFPSSTFVVTPSQPTVKKVDIARSTQPFLVTLPKFLRS